MRSYDTHSRRDEAPGRGRRRAVPCRSCQVALPLGWWWWGGG